MKKSLKPIKIEAESFLCVMQRRKTRAALFCTGLWSQADHAQCESKTTKKDKLKRGANFTTVTIKCHIRVV